LTPIAISITFGYSFWVNMHFISWLFIFFWCWLGVISMIYWLKKLGVGKDGLYTAIQFAFIVSGAFFGPFTFMYGAFLFAALKRD
jgi:hypothetical protein